MDSSLQWSNRKGSNENHKLCWVTFPLFCYTPPPRVTKSLLSLTGSLIKAAFNLYKEPAESLRSKLRHRAGGSLPFKSLHNLCSVLQESPLFALLDTLNNNFNTEKFRHCLLKSLSWYQVSARFCWSLFPALLLLTELKREKQLSSIQTGRYLSTVQLPSLEDFVPGGLFECHWNLGSCCRMV